MDFEVFTMVLVWVLVHPRCLVWILAQMLTQAFIKLNPNWNKSDRPMCIDITARTVGFCVSMHTFF